MSKVLWLPVWGLAGLLAMVSSASGQTRPYTGYVYPAGGQQGTTFPVKLGGQGLDGVNQVLVSGAGVSAKVVEYHRKFGPQEMTLLREQLNELKRELQEAGNSEEKEEATKNMIAKIEQRMAEYVNRPACVSISSLVFVEVTMAPDAEPGPRELRLVTPRGVSNPLVFYVGQLPEVSRKPMHTANFQVLGKEEQALRKRPPEEVEQRITVPCTMNGQVASGEVNWYRFEARRGQRLVISTVARQLIPYLADAVPGWFQPVLAIYDARGNELAYNDDYRFKPDPTIFFEVPQDGEYALTITDAIYRGREDFVYRVTIGEVPFVTSIFPLGGRVGSPVTIAMKGWNLETAELTPPESDSGPGVYSLAARRESFVSNGVPFALDTLPDGFDEETNNAPAAAQKVKLPIIMNGRIDRPDEWDVFQFQGRAGEAIVAEVSARRLESPLDSMLKVTDAAGNVLAFNDDHLDVGSGLNTHHADSYVMLTLPADGTYCVHVGDTARKGGEEYAYRLRIGPPQPDFALRLVPSSVSMRARGSSTVSVYAIRKDGFTGDIKLRLKDPPEGFSSVPVTMTAKQEVVRFTVKTDLTETKDPVTLVVEGRAKIGDQGVAHEAVPAEDRMQAFLWRHLVPAQELKALVYDPSYVPPPKRVYTPPAAEAKAPAENQPAASSSKPATEAPKFTKSQVAGRLRQLKTLYEDWLLTDEFYGRKVAECEAVQ